MQYSTQIDIHFTSFSTEKVIPKQVTLKNSHLKIYTAKVEIYKRSTFSLAHGVLRKNFNEDLMEGLLLKQLMSIFSAKPSQS